MELLGILFTRGSWDTVLPAFKSLKALKSPSYILDLGFLNDTIHTPPPHPSPFRSGVGGGSKILILDKLCCLSFSLAQGTGGINTIQNIKLYKIWKLTSTFIFKDDLNKFLLQVSRQTRHISSSIQGTLSNVWSCKLEIYKKETIVKILAFSYF